MDEDVGVLAGKSMTPSGHEKSTRLKRYLIAVAVAGLIRAAEEGLAGEHILLNVTGGGYQRAAEDLDRYPVEPYIRVRAGEAFAGDLRDAVRGWLAEQGVAIRA